MYPRIAGTPRQDFSEGVEIHERRRLRMKNAGEQQQQSRLQRQPVTDYRTTGAVNNHGSSREASRSPSREDAGQDDHGGITETRRIAHDAGHIVSCPDQGPAVQNDDGHAGRREAAKQGSPVRALSCHGTRCANRNDNSRAV